MVGIGPPDPGSKGVGKGVKGGEADEAEGEKEGTQGRTVCPWDGRPTKVRVES